MMFFENILDRQNGIMLYSFFVNYMSLLNFNSRICLYNILEENDKKYKQVSNFKKKLQIYKYNNKRTNDLDNFRILKVNSN